MSTESDEIRACSSEMFSMVSCKAIAKLGILYLLLYFSSTLVYAVFFTVQIHGKKVCRSCPRLHVHESIIEGRAQRRNTLPRTHTLAHKRSHTHARTYTLAHTRSHTHARTHTLAHTRSLNANCRREEISGMWVMGLWSRQDHPMAVATRGSACSSSLLPLSSALLPLSPPSLLPCARSCPPSTFLKHSRARRKTHSAGTECQN